LSQNKSRKKSTTRDLLKSLPRECRIYIEDDGSVTFSALWQDLVPLARELAGQDPEGDDTDDKGRAHRDGLGVGRRRE